MDTVFFEWSDFEQKILEQSKLNLPLNTKFFADKFNISNAIGFKNISIFVDSKITNEELLELKQAGTQKILLRCAGFNMLDCNYAKEIGIEVFRVASYSPESIAEFVFALILMLARNLNLQQELHTQFKNQRSINAMGFTLKGKTLGLHGYGKIGKEVADIARNGFKMNVQFFDPFVKDEQPDKQLNSLEELYLTSDIISIHVPLITETKGIVNAALLSNVKERFMLINTSRGEIVNSVDIENLIRSKKIDFFGTDVWQSDDKFDPDLLIDNTFQSYHVAFFTEEAVLSILNQTIENLNGSAKKENII